MAQTEPWEQRWRDYYQALGVEKSATLAEIKQAYRRKARFLHPDRMANEPEEVRRLAEEEFKLLNEASEVLNDTNRRRAYDEAYAFRMDRPRARPSKPELEIVPGEVVQDDLDIDAGSVTFSVTVRQVGGPPFDPTVHSLQISMEPPWEIDMFTRIETKSDRPPMTIEFDLNTSRFEEDEEYSGLIHVEVRTLV